MMTDSQLMACSASNFMQRLWAVVGNRRPGSEIETLAVMTNRDAASQVANRVRENGGGCWIQAVPPLSHVIRGKRNA